MIQFAYEIRVKGDGAKQINKSVCKFHTFFGCYALSPSYRVHFPRLTHSKPSRSLTAQ